jgi:hypothetical protein
VPDSKLGLEAMLVEQLDNVVVEVVEDVVDDDAEVEAVVDDAAVEDVVDDVTVTMHEQAELYGDGLVPQAEVARVG